MECIHICPLSKYTVTLISLKTLPPFVFDDWRLCNIKTKCTFAFAFASRATPSSLFQFNPPSLSQSAQKNILTQAYVHPCVYVFELSI